MRTDNIAQLKNRLNKADREEFALVAAGKLVLPEEVLDLRAFWLVGRKSRVSRKSAKAIRSAVSRDRGR